MTTIAVRNGVMASDSRITHESESGGSRVTRCVKMYRRRDAIIGVAGDGGAGSVFVDWYGSGKPVPQILIDFDADLTALVLTRRGLFTYDAYCMPEKILDRFWAIGSGTKAALGAMHMGASAERAIEIACLIDPYTAPPVHVLKLTRK